MYNAHARRFREPEKFPLKNEAKQKKNLGGTHHVCRSLQKVQRHYRQCAFSSNFLAINRHLLDKTQQDLDKLDTARQPWGRLQLVAASLGLGNLDRLEKSKSRILDGSELGILLFGKLLVCGLEL